MSMETLKLIFDWATVVLLFLTFAAGAGVLYTGSIINERQAGQIKQFEKDLRDKDVKIAEAQHGVVDAKNSASALSIELESEKQKTARFQKEADEARLALESRVRTQGPRYFLLRAAAPKLAVELSRFPGQQVAMLICGMYKTDRETLETWGSLANILGPDTVNGVKGAGWKSVRGNPIWDKCGLSMQGISVIVSPESPKTTRDAAEALSAGLQSVLPPYNKNPWVLDPAWTRQKVALGIVLDKDDPERLALENPGTIVVFIGEHPPL